jgi:NAD(P)-dependent dehydrogenase (short-subunit alcohol dehydrogenase family)
MEVVHMRTDNELWEMQGKTVLVTGDTGGLGYETARALGRRGARVIITGRRTRGEDAAMAIERESGSVASTSSGGKRPTATRRPSR